MVLLPLAFAAGPTCNEFRDMACLDIPWTVIEETAFRSGSTATLDRCLGRPPADRLARRLWEEALECGDRPLMAHALTVEEPRSWRGPTLGAAAALVAATLGAGAVSSRRARA